MWNRRSHRALRASFSYPLGCPPRVEDLDVADFDSRSNGRSLGSAGDCVLQADCQRTVDSTRAWLVAPIGLAELPSG